MQTVPSPSDNSLRESHIQQNLPAPPPYRSILWWLFGGGVIAILIGFLIAYLQATPSKSPLAIDKTPVPSPTIILLSPTPTALPTESPIPQSKTLANQYHTFQTFNNCGPAALSMALSYYGINKSQQELGNDLRPYQIANGNNDDKSVTLSELAQKGQEYDLLAYHRPMGNPQIIKQFIALGIPIITRTWLKPNEDIGHYRVIKGYDDNQQVFIQDDSLQGKNLIYSYQEFDDIWKQFSYEFLVLIPRSQQVQAESILGDLVDEQKAWQTAIDHAHKQLSANPKDIYARFNLSVALYHTKDYQQSVAEFEAVESQLPFRTLWYQIEPIQGYFELGNFDRVFFITDKILNNHNRAFSELYIIRGNIYQQQGQIEQARAQYQLAITYNRNLSAAQQALESLP